MPRPCYPKCTEKRDFMDARPPRSDAELYLTYDPWIGIGTALVLSLFFVAVTVNGFIRWVHRKYQQYQFRKTLAYVKMGEKRKTVALIEPLASDLVDRRKTAAVIEPPVHLTTA